MCHCTIWCSSKSLEDSRELRFVSENVSQGPSEATPTPLSRQRQRSLLPAPGAQLFRREDEDPESTLPAPAPHRGRAQPAAVGHYPMNASGLFLKRSQTQSGKTLITINS